MLRKKAFLYLMVVLAAASLFIQGRWILYGRNDDTRTTRSLASAKSKRVNSTKVAVAISTLKTESVMKRNVSLLEKKVPVRRAKKLRFGPFGPVYLFGAAIGNSTNMAKWDITRVYGIYNTRNDKALRQNLTCCFKYRTKTGHRIIQTNAINKWIFWAKAKLQVFHLTCKNPVQVSHIFPETVSLSLSPVVCVNSSSSYVKTLMSFKEPGTKLAIGTQIVYGNINADHIIDWMETYRHLGVDKVISYYYKLTNNRALKVLQYYHRSGFVDLYRYEPAGEDVLPRDFQQKGGQLFNDLQLVLKDSFERMFGYTYFGIIDLDEYLIPSRNRTLKEMLLDLQKTYTNAAGFVFQSQYFYTSWGKSGQVNDLIFGEYFDRTSDAPKIDNPKQIYMPQRISHGNAHVHDFDPLVGFQRIIVPAKEGYIRHYRQFRRRSNVTHMMNNVRRVRDTTLAYWSMQIKDKVYEVRRKLQAL